jgi:hypothetical protein
MTIESEELFSEDIDGFKFTSGRSQRFDFVDTPQLSSPTNSLRRRRFCASSAPTKQPRRSGAVDEPVASAGSMRRP